MEYTLGDILAEAMNNKEAKKAPILATTTTHAVVTPYGTQNKLNAIKMLRSMTGIGLREAKDCVENPIGFVLPSPIFQAISREQDAANTYFFSVFRPTFVEPCRIFC